MRDVIAELTEEVRELYTADEVPWVIGYSGGKDSTAVLQIVWLALKELPVEQRRKPVYVISTDTLVENPIVAAWVNRSLETMSAAAAEQELPIQPNRLTPEVKDTFWVNLIGKGYPAPRPKFRWCTERLKIKPSNAFIRRVVANHGEAILVLGTRKAESQARARSMEKHERYRVRDRLSPNGNLPNSLVYSPIEAWTSDDVWMFLMQAQNPWGHSNKDLLTMYQAASDDSECPLVVDSSTPSCGDSRFGCWTCTLVEQDKSMTAMIQNDEEKEWMLPLLELRNDLDVVDDRPLRDFRRLTGSVTIFHDQAVPGPYTQESREKWLRRLLEAQTWVQGHGPADVRDLSLVTLDELHEIRRIWVFEKHEIEDSLPRIYEEATGVPFPGGPLDEHMVLGSEDVDILRELCEDDPLHFEMTRSLIAVERRFRTMARRAGLFDELEKTVRRSFYADEEDATQRGRLMLEIREIRKGRSTGEQTEARDEGDGGAAAVEDLTEDAVDAAH
ncbi:DNA phosphorothioation system sulfurtransferase DndC [Kineococcus terrestris]|uniref:DNA phosphorothioation system sulfurtransferase DndC n=1 Tax=Kineococcus terrestris TaxID=2044856 RepID=UPI0034DABEDB